MKNVISFIKNNKRLLTISVAVATLVAVSILCPEHTETVARAFLAIVGIL